MFLFMSLFDSLVLHFPTQAEGREPALDNELPSSVRERKKTLVKKIQFSILENIDEESTNNKTQY